MTKADMLIPDWNTLPEIDRAEAMSNWIKKRIDELSLLGMDFDTAFQHAKNEFIASVYLSCYDEVPPGYMPQ